uniref:Uncharacterized protein n=1 Tax=Chelydra serpentina TaxID=8475 RepID=A0A8C3SJR7_CHESE
MSQQRSHIANISAKERIKDFPGHVFEDGRKLICKTCNIVLNHHRKLTISNHLTKSQKHLKEKLHCRENHKKMQRTLSACFNTTTIFLNTRVKNVGASPGGYQLQDAYLTDSAFRLNPMFNAEDCAVLYQSNVQAIIDLLATYKSQRPCTLFALEKVGKLLFFP